MEENPKRKFNWKALIIEIVKLAVAFATGTQI